MSGPILRADAPSIRANKLDLVERLADHLAHEIKNPLHSMVINLEVLKRRLARLEGSEDAARYVAVLDDELTRVSRRVELLLRLSRPGRGGAAASFNEVVEETLELLEVEARRAGASVRYDPGGRLVRVRAPREPVRQVLLNLFLDALDGLPAGGELRLQVGSEDGEARLRVLAVGAAGGCPPEDGAERDRLEVARSLAAAIGGRVDPAGPAEGMQEAVRGGVLSLPLASG